jgi:hypothetical protein
MQRRRHAVDDVEDQMIAATLMNSGTVTKAGDEAARSQCI